MNDPTEVAVVDLKNTTDKPLRVTVAVAGVERHIVTLAPGDSTRQVTPSGVIWTFGGEPEQEGQATAAQKSVGVEPADDDGEVDEVDEGGGSKGGPRRVD